MTDPSWKPDFETLSAYLDGELPPEDMARVEAYVKDHPETQQELDELRALDARVAAPVPGEPQLQLDAFTRKMWEEVDRHRERSKGFGGFPLRFAWVPLAAAAAIVVVMRSNLHRPEVLPRRAAVTQAAPARDEAPAMSPPVRALAPKAERKQESRRPARQAEDALAQKDRMKRAEPAPPRSLAEERVAPPRADGAPAPAAPPGADAGSAATRPASKPAAERPVDNLIRPVGTLAGVSSRTAARAPSAAKASPETLEGFLRRVGSQPDKAKKELKLGSLGKLTHQTGIMRPRQIDSASGAENENAPNEAAQRAAPAPGADTLALLANAADALLADGRTGDAQQALGWMIERYDAAPPTPRVAYRVELAVRGVDDPLAKEDWEPGDAPARWTAAVGSWRDFAARWKTPEGWTAAGVSLALQYRQSRDVSACRQARECFRRALDASPPVMARKRIGSLQDKYAECPPE